MIAPMPVGKEQVLYQSDPNKVSTLQSIRAYIHQTCSSHVNRLVRVQTLDGHVYEGVIVHTDGHHVHLRLSNPSRQRAFLGPGLFGGGFGPGFGFGSGFGFGPSFSPGFGASEAAILTLVLFELLVIVLLA